MPKMGGTQHEGVKLLENVLDSALIELVVSAIDLISTGLYFLLGISTARWMSSSSGSTIWLRISLQNSRVKS